MYSLDELKQALVYGCENNYVLFPEARDIESHKNKEQIDTIKTAVEKSLEEGSPVINFEMFKEFENTGNRLIFEAAYFERRKQVVSLVLAYMLEEAKEYKTIIEEKLWEWCELYSWELPAHFKMTKESMEQGIEEPDKTVALFAAESGFFFAEILSLIGNELDGFLVYRLKKEIFRRVINPYKSSSYWWDTAEMNWSSVCAGSVGAAAIYLVEDIDELAAILQRVINSMECYLKSFDKDGITAEGLSYWSYGFSFYVIFAELLKERTCGRVSLLKDQDKVKNIARIPQILQFPSGHFVNFSDSGRAKWQGECGLFSKLEKEFGIKGYNYDNSLNLYNDNTYRWAVMARKVFWYSNSSSSNSPVLGNFYFGESQWLVNRSCKDGIFTAFAARGGNNDEPHNHNDLGHFIIHHNEENIFIDLGSPEYVKEYFINETRYNYLTASSLGHSVPVINGKGQSFGKEHASKVIKYEDANSAAVFTLELKEAYDCKELVSFEREFTWNSDMLQLEIKDSFKFNKAHNDIKESFITDFKPELIERGRIRITAKNSVFELLYSEKLECIIEECVYKDHSGNDRLIYRTSILVNADEKATYDFKVKLTKNM